MSANRLLKLIKPVISGCELIKCEGSETMSESFIFYLTFYILENYELNKQDLIEQSISFQIKTRIFNGLIWRCERSNKNLLKLTVVSWFYFFKLNSDCRIFRQKTTLDIFKQVCRKNGIYDFDFSLLKDTYPIKNYTVQYNETDFNFLNRILNEAGVDYYFEHKSSRHLMKLCDRFLKEFLYLTVSSIKAWRHYVKEQPSRIKVIGYNYRLPHRFYAFSKENKNSFYTRSYYLSGCLNSQDAQKKADQLFYSLKNQSDYVEGKSHEINFSVGCQFRPFNIENSNYFLIKVKHKAYDNTRYNSVFSVQSDFGQFYENCFTAIPMLSDFSKRRINNILTVSGFSTRCLGASRQSVFRIHEGGERRQQSRKWSREGYSCYCRPMGVQSAKVTGPIKGEPFTDRMGRIKVRFFWEREKNNPLEIGYWIRAAQPWASSGFGVQFLPRVGDEVLIGFRCGNPDDPILLGSLYNRTNALPYLQNQSGFKSSLIGRHSEQENALWVDDTPKRETFNIKAAQNFSTFVRKNESTIVDQSYISNISGNQSVYSQQRIVWTSGETISISAGNTQIILKPSSIHIKGEKIDLNV